MTFVVGVFMNNAMKNQNLTYFEDVKKMFKFF